jgi:hypothetical protein
MIVTISKTFFPQHERAGEATEFGGKVRSGEKRHTCRQNYEYWKRQIESVQARGGVLSVKQWIGRPYHKPGQEPVLDIPADVVGLQRLELRRERLGPNYKLVTRWTGPYEWTATVDGRPVPIGMLAANDGLTVEDFKAWFAPAFNKAERKYPALASLAPATIIEFAIIHFTKFRY